MKRTVPQPIKIIDNFLEAPELWRHYGLKHVELGCESPSLDYLNLSLFHSIASALMMHIYDKKTFAQLKLNFVLGDASFNKGWVQQVDPHWNIAGTIFLNPNPPRESGLLIHSKTGSTDQNYAQMILDEESADPEARIGFEKFKIEQRMLYKQTMTIENVFNRCVIMPANEWYNVTNYFGDTKDTARLTLNFYGVAV